MSNHLIRILGVDPSIRSTGIACVEFDNRKPYSTMKLTTVLAIMPKQTVAKKTREYNDRQKDILMTLKVLAPALDPHIAVVENQVISEKYGNKIGLDLAALSGALIGNLQEHTLAKIINPYSSEWQSAITGVTSANEREPTKVASVKMALLMFGDKLPPKILEVVTRSLKSENSYGRDIADALCMTLFGVVCYIENPSRFDRPNI